MVYCDTLAECQLLGRVEGTPAPLAWPLTRGQGRGALCSLQSYCTHGREKEQQFWVCNYED